MNPSTHLPTRPIAAPRWLALGSALLWGALELFALWRSRAPHRAQ
jgi:hypothetical protein